MTKYFEHREVVGLGPADKTPSKYGDRVFINLAFVGDFRPLLTLWIKYTGGNLLRLLHIILILGINDEAAYD